MGRTRPGTLLDDGPVGAEVEVDQVAALQQRQDRVDATHVDQDGLAQLVEDLQVNGAGGTDGPDERRALALEDGDEARDAALDGFVEDDVGLVEARLGPGVGVVVDLHRQGGTLRDRTARAGGAR